MSLVQDKLCVKCGVARSFTPIRGIINCHCDECTRKSLAREKGKALAELSGLPTRVRLANIEEWIYGTEGLWLRHKPA